MAYLRQCHVMAFSNNCLQQSCQLMKSLHCKVFPKACHQEFSTSTGKMKRTQTVFLKTHHECMRQKKGLQRFSICRQEYSTSSKSPVTLENIFSSFNKLRVQNHLLKYVKSKPVSISNHAAVLVPLCTIDGEPSVLFTLRSTSLRKHRGQVSFPGGRMDETDENAIHTALRETQEELGLSMDAVEVWGTMMDLPSRDKSLVTPVIGYCGELDTETLTLSEDEVELVFTRTIKSLCDLKNVGQTQYKNGYTMPVYLGGEHRIWGLTSFVLHLTLTALAPGLYNFKLIHKS